MSRSPNQYTGKEVVSFLAWLVPITLLLIGFSLEHYVIIQLGGFLLIARTLFYYFKELETE